MIHVQPNAFVGRRAAAHLATAVIAEEDADDCRPAERCIVEWGLASFFQEIDRVPPDVSPLDDVGEVEVPEAPPEVFLFVRAEPQCRAQVAERDAVWVGCQGYKDALP